MTGDLAVAPGGNLIHILNASVRQTTIGSVAISTPIAKRASSYLTQTSFRPSPVPCWGYHGCTVRLSGEVDGYVSFFEKKTTLINHFLPFSKLHGQGPTFPSTSSFKIKFSSKMTHNHRLRRTTTQYNHDIPNMVQGLVGNLLMLV